MWMVDVDDECGWLEGGKARKKVGISSLSKKSVIRQARAKVALVGIHV